jgi:hypothetical protein
MAEFDLRRRTEPAAGCERTGIVVAARATQPIPDHCGPEVGAGSE